ncbi:SCO family protein [Lacinutrix undariae]
MRYLKLVLSVFIITITIISCNSKAPKNTDTYQCPMQCEGDKIYSEITTCPICKMDMKLIKDTSIKNNDKISQASIFNLTSKWHTEEGNEIQLKSLRGKTLVVVMIYTSCKAACPRLVADMRNIEAQIPIESLEKLNFVLITIDPKTDTPERLKAFALENYMDDEQWTFLQGTESSVREFANVLAMKYKQISPIDFSHSNIISVFNPEGELVHQQEGLGVNNKETVNEVLKLIK